MTRWEDRAETIERIVSMLKCRSHDGINLARDLMLRNNMPVDQLDAYSHLYKAVMEDKGNRELIRQKREALALLIDSIQQ